MHGEKRVLRTQGLFFCQVVIDSEEPVMLEKVKGIEMDYVTFSGLAEPTLAANLAELVTVVRENVPGRPIAILKFPPKAF